MDNSKQSAKLPATPYLPSTFSAIKAECLMCPQRNLTFCRSAGKPIEQLVDCPIGEWNREAIKPRVLWLHGDFSRGGTSRYTTEIIRMLSPYIDSRLMYYRTDFFDQTCANLLPSHEVYTATAYEEAVAWADIVSATGISSHIPVADKLLEVAASKLFSQLHGTCQYTRDLFTLNRKYTSRFMGCSQKSLEACYPDSDCTYFVPPFPVDFNRCLRQRTNREARLRFGLPDAPCSKVITVACRQSNDKNLIGIAEAVASLSSFYLLHCVGSGYAQETLHPQMKSLLGSRVIFSPWQTLPSDYLDASDCFLCMSPDEGGPFTIIEAMVHGTPVVSTNVGVVSEYILQTVGDLDRPIIYPYASPEDISRACIPISADLKWKIFQQLCLKHSPAAIVGRWLKWFGINKPN